MKKMTVKQKDELRKQIVEFAKKFISFPYQYGIQEPENPKAFDCSSFVQYIYKNFGYEIPRSTILQALHIKKTVKNIKEIKPADLIFLHGTRGYYTEKFPQGIGHVAMYIGDKKVIHASGNGKNKGVKIEDLKKVIKERKPLVVIKRVI
jgi:cell wall-associated NlpC family hydrolase